TENGDTENGDTENGDTENGDTENGATTTLDGIACTCINGTSGYFFNSTGGTPTLTLVPSTGANGSSSGNSFREINGE
ncbi:MAG: hypothetical protein Q9M22_06340, partial [Mariprofundaceae bacterium]|nr:hypothetical protein [Mariprofundaceae bacterium]